MARSHYFIDRAQIWRVPKSKNKGRVTEAEAIELGGLIPCLLRNISGKEDERPPLTLVPENAILIVAIEDENGDPVSIQQGDELTIQYNQNGILTAKPKKYKIVGDIVPIRRGREVVSWQLEVTMYTEH